jgi:CHAT domain-containing protein/tetratricopeptide (TPR) repeat protein
LPKILRSSVVRLRLLLSGILAVSIFFAVDGSPSAAAAKTRALKSTSPPKSAPPKSAPAAVPSSEKSLDQTLAALSRKIEEKKPGEAAPIAAEALQLAIKQKSARWILPLAAAVPSLYAQAGEMVSAERYYHALMLAILYGDVTAPDDELEKQVRYLTDAFIEHGGASDAIRSLEKLFASIRASEDEKSKAGAFLFRVQGQAFQRYLLYDFSIQSHQKALDLAKRAFAADSPEMAYILNDIGYAYLAATRWQEAEAPLKESLRIREQVDADNLVEIGTTCQNLATIFIVLKDLSNAERFADRAVEARKQALGTQHLKYLESRYTLATVLHFKKEYKQAIEIFEDTQRGYHDAGNVLGEAGMMAKLAAVFEDQGDLQKSGQFRNDAIALAEGLLDDPDTPIILGVALQDRIARKLELGDLEGAKADAAKLLSLLQGRVGSDHNMTLTSLESAMSVDLAAGDIDRAMAHGEQALSGLESQFSRILNGSNSERGLDQERLFEALFRIASTAKGREAITFDRTLQIVQWSELGSTSSALRQMATRAASINPQLADQVRDAQDLAARSNAVDIRLSGLESAPPGQRDEATIASLRGDLRRINAELATRQAAIRQAFPEYTSLVSAAPIDVAEVQRLLRDNEAMVKFFMPDKPWKDSRAFVWAITKQRTPAWAQLSLPAQEIADLVAALRCGLDRTAWQDQADPQCAKLLNMPVTDAIDPLPFDLVRSHKLYQALFDPVADLIEGKQLIIVPSGPLTQLPFQVLVTAEPEFIAKFEPATKSEPAAKSEFGAGAGASDLWRGASWLVRQHALSVLPSISSLQALRANAKPSRAEKAFIGFGNPLLDGQQDDLKYGDDYRELAHRARERQSCPMDNNVQTAMASLHQARGIGSIFRGRQADVDELRKWSALPETADELCAVGHQLGASDGDIYLGSRATEGRLKDLSERGDLKRYATVHFATHGALTGEVKGIAEPGLILTPPESTTTDPDRLARDDGFLSASEITTLLLDANLVIMAACNTAGSSGETADALSGIARAFFYAGARSLLVSHWEVYSEATVRLMIDMARSSAAGRAQALQESMVAMIDRGRPEEAHPAYWAPFVLVGEGAK